jgi:hypothetical protein
MKEFNDSLLEIVSKNIESEKKRLNDLDTKAIGIITIIGIVVVFISKPENLGRLSATIYLITILSFLITILLCVLVLRQRDFNVLVTKYLIDDFRDENLETQRKGIIDTSAEVEASLTGVCKSKGKYLRLAVHALGISILFLIIYSIVIHA